MAGFVHTPYGDGTSPFSIGLKPLDVADWLETGPDLSACLAEKQRLDSEASEPVFMAEPGTGSAQGEVLELMVSHLADCHASTHRVEGQSMLVAGRHVNLNAAEPALKIAAKLVAEDLVLMRRNDDGSGWRITAASLHFPSSWSLSEKFGRALADVHAPVPGFQRGTRNATIIDRIFDRLLVDQPVRRTNFSLYDNPELHHPYGKSRAMENGYGHLVPDMFIRCEYQTLRKLEASGDILFTIRIHIDPMAALAAHPECEALCGGLIRALRALDADQLTYKGLGEAKCAALIARLEAICS